MVKRQTEIIMTLKTELTDVKCNLFRREAHFFDTVANTTINNISGTGRK